MEAVDAVSTVRDEPQHGLRVHNVDRSMEARGRGECSSSVLSTVCVSFIAEQPQDCSMFAFS